MSADALSLLLALATLALAAAAVGLALSQRRAFAGLSALDGTDLARSLDALGHRLDGLARRVETDGDGVRRDLAALDRDLRLTLAEGARAGLAEAFARVQEGGRLQAEATERVGAVLREGVGRMNDALRDGVAAMNEALRALDERVAEGQGRTEAGLGAQREALLRDLAEGRAAADAGRRAGAEALARDLGVLGERTRASLDALAGGIRADAERLRESVGAKLDELRAGNEAKLEAMREAVDERLQSALEKRVGESFQRVAEQFAEVQRAIGDVRVVTGQVGDLKRLFSNVKARGGWGEAHVKALLDDVLPQGAYATNLRLRDGSADAVEFALRMPAGAGVELWLPIDSKFPTEDYDRLLLAAELGDAKAEGEARRALEVSVRAQAKLIKDKYVVPPRTVEFAVMYLPTEGLFAEVHRTPGLVAEMQSKHRIMVVGPTLLPALLHHIRLGHLTLTLERKAGDIGDTLGAVKAEWDKLGRALDAMGKRAEGLTRDIGEAQRRTRAVGRKLRTVEAIDGERADRMLGIEGPGALDALLDEEVELRAAE